jgi:hypothetical protein
MALDVTPMLCPFTIASDIFTLKNTAKMHYNNVGLNFPPMAVYQAALADL